MVSDPNINFFPPYSFLKKEQIGLKFQKIPDQVRA